MISFMATEVRLGLRWVSSRLLSWPLRCSRCVNISRLRSWPRDASPDSWSFTIAFMTTRTSLHLRDLFTIAFGDRRDAYLRMVLHALLSDSETGTQITGHLRWSFNQSLLDRVRSTYEPIMSKHLIIGKAPAKWQTMRFSSQFHAAAASSYRSLRVDNKSTRVEGSEGVENNIWCNRINRFLDPKHTIHLQDCYLWRCDACDAFDWKLNY